MKTRLLFVFAALALVARADIPPPPEASAAQVTARQGTGYVSARRLPAGSTGTVTVVASGNLTNTAIVTGGGSQTIQTPSATATMDGSGNISTPGSIVTGAGGTVGGYTAFGQGTATTAPTASVGFMAPTSVSTKFMFTLPAAPATGVMLNTGASDPTVISFIAPGTSGNVLTSNGATWASSTPSSAAPTVNAQTGTTYTLVLGDANNAVTMSNASANTLTVPPNSSVAFVIGSQIPVQQLGAGATTIAAGGGVTINSPNTLVIGVQYGWVTLVKTGTDTWQLGTLPQTIINPIIATGLTASGSIANDFSGSTGGFKPSTGTFTFTGAVNSSTSGDFDLSAGTGAFKVPTGGLVVPNSSLANRFRSNSSVTAQAPAATTRTYVTGSDIGPFTAAQIKVGTFIEWDMSITKTGAGTATSVFDVAFGTAGTTSDTAQVSFTKPAGVGNADTCHVHITAVVKTNSATGVVLGDFTLTDDQTNTLGGFLGAAKYASVLQVQSSTFNTTTPTHVGLCITTGASDAYTINYCTVKSWNL